MTFIKEARDSKRTGGFGSISGLIIVVFFLIDKYINLGFQIPLISPLKEWWPYPIIVVATLTFIFFLQYSSAKRKLEQYRRH